MTSVAEGELSESRIRDFSKSRGEPDWMLRFRLHSLESYRRQAAIAPMGLTEALGHFGAERGQASEYAAPDTAIVARRMAADVRAQGVQFLDTDAALVEHPEILRARLGTVLPPEDDPLAALNGAVWSGGSLISVPAGVRVKFPLQADMLPNARKVGPFERTLVVAGEGSRVEFIDGCTSPLYVSQSVSAAVVEVVALPGAHVRYIEFQNWSSGVSNLIRKRAHAHAGASVAWLDANVGSRRTENVPAVHLLGPGARAEFVSISLAGGGRHVETGAHAVHASRDTSSRVVCRSVLRDGGRATHRLGLSVSPGATGSTSSMEWKALLLDDASRCETYPAVEVRESGAAVAQDGALERLSEDAVFYLMQRGYARGDAVRTIVCGLLDVFLKEIPMEYAVEFNRLIELELEGGGK